MRIKELAPQADQRWRPRRNHLSEAALDNTAHFSMDSVLVSVAAKAVVTGPYKAGKPRGCRMTGTPSVWEKMYTFTVNIQLKGCNVAKCSSRQRASEDFVAVRLLGKDPLMRMERVNAVQALWRLEDAVGGITHCRIRRKSGDDPAESQRPLRTDMIIAYLPLTDRGEWA
ncbi:hypothetical protein NM688_g8569 [Phlebia brevispora]|uniref:Uncharacterized protein n=1 Tax=Phlebia brevispora TaxID=194682 RepID=A0ACC1RTJ9_9APHY|nr:hypothetical protein NM688_g8569 [Phlebia brevispora]